MPEGSEGLLEGPGGLPEGPEGLPEGLAGRVYRDGWTDGQTDIGTDIWNLHSFCRTLSQLGAAAQKRVKMKIK